MKLKWQVSIYHFTAFFLQAFSYFFAQTLPAARKGMKRQKRGFSRVPTSEFNTVKQPIPLTRPR